MGNASSQLQSAYEHFNAYRGTLKMTTGSPELDSIIDGHVYKLHRLLSA